MAKQSRKTWKKKVEVARAHAIDCSLFGHSFVNEMEMVIDKQAVTCAPLFNSEFSFRFVRNREQAVSALRSASRMSNARPVCFFCLLIDRETRDILYLALISRFNVCLYHITIPTTCCHIEIHLKNSPIKPLALHARHSTAKQFNLCGLFFFLPPPPPPSMPLSVPQVFCFYIQCSPRFGSHFVQSEIELI